MQGNCLYQFLSHPLLYPSTDKMVIFVAATWLAGYISTLLGMPSLVGEITAGFLLGPPLADFVPYPAAVVLIGKFGLLGLIVESGIGIDVAQLKETGLRAVAMAFVGTALPLTAGLGLGRAAGLDFRSAMAIGACFAPSSFSVVANVLCKGEVLNTPVGQLIVASSVVDDVLGLILLSILEVFVNEDPKAIDFVIPFISSFGYLLVLGYLGLTWIPHTIEHKIMPLFAERHREFVAFGMMFLLLIIYLPLLDYSGASYLTGAFLAGLSFSQIHSVHASFMRNGRQILTWLLRMFFAATIGFQIPVTYFQDLYVLRWGGKFCKFTVPVLTIRAVCSLSFLTPDILPVACIVAKGLLGLAVPRGEHKLPEDFPYDPYWRDVTITSLAIMCRGEFNFIIASFALGEGLFGPDLYSAVVFAILVSAIVGPLLLSNVIQFYNEKSKAYLASSHPIKRDGNTCDGLRPLFLAIQTRTPIHWGLQETFKKALEKAGLIIIDHRSVHTLGLNAVDITELFVQDTKVKIKVPHCFGPTDDSEWAEPSSPQTVVLDEATTTKDAPGTSDDFSVENGVSAAQEIQERCDEINHGTCRCMLERY
jgi:Kef-type K+ transport system membrane component KefB